jgi:putative endonuclease
MTRSRVDEGRAAEAFVAGRLERQGYRVLDRNVQVRGGELDIVALDGDELVFIEVRARTNDAYGLAEASVDRRKLLFLMRSAGTYIARRPEHEDRVWRVDLVAITLDSRGVIKSYQHYTNLTLD